MVATPHMDLDQDVAVEDHQVSGHLRGDLDLTLLQLLVHAEQDVMCIAVVTCGGNRRSCQSNNA